MKFTFTFHGKMKFTCKFHGKIALPGFRNLHRKLSKVYITHIIYFFSLQSDYIKLLLWHIENDDNHTIDFRKPFIKSSLRYVYPLFIFLFSCIVIGGVIANTTILIMVGAP